MNRTSCGRPDARFHEGVKPEACAEGDEPYHAEQFLQDVTAKGRGK